MILGYAYYRAILHLLAGCADWETLPPHIQDAIDGMLADEAREEQGESIPLDRALRESGDVP